MKKIIFFGSVLVLMSIVIINYRTPFFQQIGGGWSVGFNFSSSFPQKIKIDKNKIFSIEKLKKQVDSTEFLADPFFLKEKDTFYIFFEHKKLKKHPAEIGLLTSNDGINYKYKGTVLREKFHLSYPQVFKYKNEFYMVPESQASNNVLLYKAQKFPYSWKIIDTLLPNLKLKDPTIFLSDTLNVLVGCNQNAQMFVYNSNSLRGKWGLNKKPIAMCGSESRPGGRFFNDGKGLVLPVQNSSNSYGTGISLYRFTFDKDKYNVSQEKHFFMKGQKNIKEFRAGMHQLDIQKIDGKYYYVYDGNKLYDSRKIFNFKKPLKLTYQDIKNWIMY